MEYGFGYTPSEFLVSMDGAKYLNLVLFEINYNISTVTIYNNNKNFEIE